MKQPPVINTPQGAMRRAILFQRVIWTGAALFGAVVVASLIHQRVRTVRSMDEISGFLASSPSRVALKTRYGQGTKVYPTVGELTRTFRRGLTADPDCEYHLYQREGLPYWYFVAVVDRKTDVVRSGVVTNYGWGIQPD